MNSLPSEIIHHVFEYLPAKDLTIASVGCKLFYKIAQSENLPMRLFIPKLKDKIIQENALTLWNNPNGNFTVNEEGKLIQLRFYNFLAKFFKWNEREILTKKITKTVEITLQEIYRVNQQGWMDDCNDSHSFARRHLYVWDTGFGYSPCYPADYLVDKILNSKQFNDSKIYRAAQLVKGQENLYEKDTSVFVLHHSINRDTRILLDDYNLFQ